jgi:hypothetical protein
MTRQGGSSAYGVSFSYDPSASTYTKLADFNGSNGRNAQGIFVQTTTCTVTPAISIAANPGNNVCQAAK